MTATHSTGMLVAGSGGRRLDHVTLTVADLDAAVLLFDALLTPLGLNRLVDYEDPEDEDEAGVEAVGYGTEADTAVLWLVTGSEPTTNAHLAFIAPTRTSVDDAYAAALAAGALTRAAPRPWQIYRPGRYTAMVVDSGGNVIEIVVDEG